MKKSFILTVGLILIHTNSLLALKPSATVQSPTILARLRAELRANPGFETNLRRARKELARYTQILNVQKIRSPEEGEQIYDRLFDLRLWVNSWTDIPSDSIGYKKFREVKDGVILLLMQTADEILELDRFGSYNYEGWEILASARRYVVKLRAVPLKEITNRQLLESMLDGLDNAKSYISLLPIRTYRDEIGFVWSQIQSTHDNVIARIQELEKGRAEMRKSA